MASEQFVNVSYRGIDVGRSLRLAEFGPSTAYLQVTAPMPVGTQLDLETDGGLSIAARVLRVQEQVAGAEHPPGMRIVVGDLSGDAKTWWQGFVEGEDPTIPEPHIIVAPSSEVAEAVVAEPSAVAEDPSAAAELAAAGRASELSAPAPKDGKSRTLVMDVSELQAALAAGNATVDDDSSAVPGELDARPTVEMAAVDIAAIEAEMAAAEAAKEAKAAESTKAPEEPEPEGKKKKKRRRRRKKS